jgi:hypothetical protein
VKGLRLIVHGSIERSTIYYLPHGVTTLSVLIRNDENHRCSLILRPENRSKPPNYVAHENSKDGIHLSSEDLDIIWGGGMTEGFVVNLEAKKDVTQFFQVIHKSKDLASYTVTLELMEIKDDKSIQLIEKINIILIPPEVNNNLVHLVTRYTGLNTRYDEFEGQTIAKYVSRWFGNGKYSFTERSSSIPHFILKYKEKENYVSKQIQIEAKNNSQEKIIGTIKGDLEQSRCQADLFDFTSSHCILRIWLYWINDDFGDSLLLSGSGNGSRDSTYLSGATRDDTELGAWKQSIIEVPDMERFDLVINKESLVLEYVGTDLHWRETWWHYSGQHANLRFANLSTVPFLIFNLPNIIKSYISKTLDADPSELLKDDLEAKVQVGSKNLLVKDEDPIVDASGNTTLGHGLYRKHVPYVTGYSLQPKYYSKDVRIINQLPNLNQ